MQRIYDVYADIEYFCYKSTNIIREAFRDEEKGLLRRSEVEAITPRNKKITFTFDGNPNFLSKIPGNPNFLSKFPGNPFVVVKHSYIDCKSE